MQKTPAHWRNAVLEHEQMIVAFEARDSETLSSLLERHVTGTTVGIAREYIKGKEAEAGAPAEKTVRRGKAHQSRDPQQVQI